MTRLSSSAEAANRDFYGDLYGGRSPLLHLLRARLSFDQRSKAEPNLEVLEPVLAELVAEAGARHLDSRRRPGDPASGPRSFRLLDYGCGWGTLLLRLRRYPLELYGYDLVPTAVPAVARAAALLGGAVHVAPEPPVGPLPPAHYDVIVCSHVLEHVDDDRKLLAAFHAALAPGGHLLLNVPVDEVWMDPKHVRPYTAEGLERLVTAVGFSVRDRRTVDRWTAALLTRARTAGGLSRTGLRALRGLLALPPWRWVEAAGERMLGPRHAYQQLILLCRKDG